MNFELLDPEEFRQFAAKSPYKSFYQTPEIASLREQNGWTPYYFGVRSGASANNPAPEASILSSKTSTAKNDLIAAAMIVAKPTFLGKSTFYCPGGPLLNYEDAELTNFFFKNLKKYAKSHNGYLLHIEPYYELIERDRHGAPVEGGFNRTKAVQNLKAAGLRPCSTSDEPKYAFVLELKGRTPDQLFADMKRNTRNHTRKAEKKGVKIRELKREELSIFKQITESTSKRRNFSDKPLSYYEKMYDLFSGRGEVKFLLAEADTGEKHRLTPLSSAMFMLYGDEIVYLFSGSAEEYMKEYNAQYLIQWHMIKYAAEHKFKRYNFYGIQGLPDKDSKDYGIYDFKKGFTSDETGRVTELIGAHEIPLNQVFYTLHQFLRRLKRR